MLTKQNLCRHVVFSQNCCFVANFVDKALVDDSTSWNAWNRQPCFQKLAIVVSTPPFVLVHVNALWSHFQSGATLRVYAYRGVCIGFSWGSLDNVNISLVKWWTFCLFMNMNAITNMTNRNRYFLLQIRLKLSLNPQQYSYGPSTSCLSTTTT